MEPSFSMSNDRVSKAQHPHGPADAGNNLANDSRRNLLKAAALGGLGAGIGGGASAATPTRQEHSSAGPWHYEADVVVVGAGATGLVAAIRARDAGLSVIVLEQNFDAGGKMLDSAGLISLGAGDPFQLRDIAGAGDAEGFVTVPPLHPPQALREDADFLFTDITDWSVVDASGQAPYRYNERGLHRAWADNCAATGAFLSANLVRVSRVTGTHLNGGVSRARRVRAILRLHDTTDVERGLVSQADAGVAGVSSSLFAPRLLTDASKIASAGTVGGGAAISRPLEYSARRKGVRFLFHRHMDALLREQAFAGAVLGVSASYVPRQHPDTGQRLQGLWQNGDIDDSRAQLQIRAKRAVVLASGGHSGNPQFRSMFDPAAADPAYASSAASLLGPHGQDASGILAGMRIGANLSGMQQNLAISATFRLPWLAGVRDAYNQMLPGHPTFAFRKAAGVEIRPEQFQHLIVVNQVGQRIYDEVELTRTHGSPVWPGGTDAGLRKPSLEHVQGDWRNAAPEWIRQSYQHHPGLAAAVAINEGSSAPDYHAGLLWVIFDDAGAARAGLTLGAPFLSDNGYYFQADDIEQLATRIESGCQYQRVPLRHLASTVQRWNRFAEQGVDGDFGREKHARLQPINGPRLHAAALCPLWHDSYGGLRINASAQVLDTQGEVIAGLYAGGEVSGGGSMHGLGRALVHGYIIGGAISDAAA
jgi:hypothetical protein